MRDWYRKRFYVIWNVSPVCFLELGNLGYVCLLANPDADKSPERWNLWGIFPLSLSCSLPTLRADRFVRLEGGAQPAPVVLANNGKDVMAFRDKPRYLAEDVSLTWACIRTHTHTRRHAYFIISPSGWGIMQYVRLYLTQPLRCYCFKQSQSPKALTPTGL